MIIRSGYYKWLKDKDKLNQYKINRKDLGTLIIDIHNKKPSYGYHRINAVQEFIDDIVYDNNYFSFNYDIIIIGGRFNG